MSFVVRRWLFYFGQNTPLPITRSKNVYMIINKSVQLRHCEDNYLAYLKDIFHASPGTRASRRDARYSTHMLSESAQDLAGRTWTPLDATGRHWTPLDAAGRRLTWT